MLKLTLQASGFKPEHYDTATKLSHLKYQLSLGNTCLVLANCHADYKGVYVSVVNGLFWIRGGNSSERKPYVYANNNSLWVPRDFITTVNQQEETTMDLVSVVMAEQLFAITVEFSKGGQRYAYKSQTEIEVGAKVVVDSPTNGFVVVEVVACDKGLNTTTDKLPAYKWVVDIVDVAEYNRLRDVEKSMVEKAKAKARLEAAHKQLEELGFTQDELVAMVKGNA